MIGVLSRFRRWKDGFVLQQKIEAIEVRESQLFETVMQLLRQIEGFVFPREEIRSQQFLAELSALREDLLEARKDAKSDLVFKSGFIRDYSSRQLEYFKSTEDELRGIIELLSEGLKTVKTGHSELHRNMATHLESLGSISQLDDLRQVREQLTREIQSVQASLKEAEGRQEEQMETLAGEVSALRSKLEAAEEEARHDALTGVLNRRALNQVLDSWLAQYRSGGPGFTVVLMDLDEFKQLNDQFGHGVGDRALLAVVENCRSFIRQGDVLARYGGDEFIYLFPGSSARNATKIARKICEALASTTFTLEDGAAGVQQLQLSASFGVTECRKGDSFESILERADKALYKAKRGGRRAVVQG